MALAADDACLGTLVLQFCLGFRFAVVGEAESGENLFCEHLVEFLNSYSDMVFDGRDIHG